MLFFVRAYAGGKTLVWMADIEAEDEAGAERDAAIMMDELLGQFVRARPNRDAPIFVAEPRSRDWRAPGEPCCCLACYRKRARRAA